MSERGWCEFAQSMKPLLWLGSNVEAGSTFAPHLPLTANTVEHFPQVSATVERAEKKPQPFQILRETNNNAHVHMCPVSVSLVRGWVPLV